MKDMENRQMSSDWGVITAFAGIICLQTVCERDESAENLPFGPFFTRVSTANQQTGLSPLQQLLHSCNKLILCEILPSSA